MVSRRGGVRGSGELKAIQQHRVQQQNAHVKRGCFVFQQIQGTVPTARAILAQLSTAAQFTDAALEGGQAVLAHLRPASRDVG